VEYVEDVVFGVGVVVVKAELSLKRFKKR